MNRIEIPRFLVSQGSDNHLPKLNHELEYYWVHNGNRMLVEPVVNGGMPMGCALFWLPDGKCQSIPLVEIERGGLSQKALERERWLAEFDRKCKERNL